MSKYAASAVAVLALSACRPSAPAPSAEASTSASAATSTTATTTTTTTLGRGDVAPPFSLQGSDGAVHALSDHAGKDVVVVAWFPKAFTGG